MSDDAKWNNLDMSSIKKKQMTRTTPAKVKTAMETDQDIYIQLKFLKDD